MTDTTTPTTVNPDTWTGAIAHTELGSNDPGATTTFLNKVFGMQFDTMPGPGDMDYHMAYVEGRPSCGVRSTMEQENGPSQTPYITVDDLDATVENAVANGATLMLPKTPVGGQGWMAWFTIPGGNTIAAWQNDQNAG